MAHEKTPAKRRCREDPAGAGGTAGAGRWRGAAVCAQRDQRQWQTRHGGNGEHPAGQRRFRHCAKAQGCGCDRSAYLFRWYVGQKGAASKLQYGDFTLQKSACSYDAIIAVLSTYAKAETVRVTVPEGTTAIAIAQKMEAAGLCSAEDFLKEANEGDFSEYTFWQYVPDDADAPDRFMKCEGYLFPETYEFLKDDTVHNYVATFYAQFDAQITDEMYAELKKQDMTLPQPITLASFVQEEAGNSQDSNVAQVFHNRLAADSPYPRLQSNTSSYIQSDSDNNYLWNWVAPYYGGWDNIPENIVAAYDTYSCKGLPAGPISNPGIAAIKAALAPSPMRRPRMPISL